MALSNWDTFAMNEKGEPCKGEFVSPLGVCVAIYKNWIYVRDEVAWKEGGHHIKPTVMEVFRSELEYKDISIVSDFIDNSVFVAVWIGWEHKGTLKGMVGCGVCGFDEEGEYVGVTEKHIDVLKDFLNTERDYFQIPSVLSKLSLGKGKRFNQGDMYFHEKLGTDKQCSVPRKAEEPFLTIMLKEM